MATIIERTRNWLDRFWTKPDIGLLKQEIARADLSTTRSIIGGHPANGLTPERIASLLRASEDGDADGYLDLAEQMEERDLHYLSVLGTRKRQVAQLPITVEAVSDEATDQKVAAFIREWLGRDALEGELFDILDAIGKGFSATEIVWETDGPLFFPDALKYRLPRWFTFDRETGEIPLLKGSYGGAPGREWAMPLPPAKFVFHQHPAKSGLPIRGGFARPVAWAYLFKNYTLKDWVAFAEIYGRPFRIGKYPAGATEEQISTLMMAVAGMGEDAAAVIPDSMLIELVDSKATGTAELYERLCTYLDQQISKAVLGQTATTDSVTGGLGSGKEHADVRADIERADARLLANTIQRDIVLPMVRLNFGDGVVVPKLKIGREEEWDATKMMPMVATFVALGGKVEKSIIADKLGLPDPPEGYDEENRYLTTVAQPVMPEDWGDAEKRPVEGRKGPGGIKIPETAAMRFFGGSLRYLSRHHGAGDPRDLIAAAVGAEVARKLDTDISAAEDAADAAAAYFADEWEEILSPMVDPIVAAMRNASNYEEAVEAMTKAIGEMDTSRLEDAVARGSLVSRAAAES